MRVDDPGTGLPARKNQTGAVGQVVHIQFEAEIYFAGSNWCTALRLDDPGTGLPARKKSDPGLSDRSSTEHVRQNGVVSI